MSSTTKLPSGSSVASSPSTATESLRKAHALSAQAASLIDTTPPPVSSTTLRSVLENYQAALSLFESASNTGGGGGGDKTLDLLVAQHRGVVRDVQRRIGVAERTERLAGVDTGVGSGPIPSNIGIGSAQPSIRGRVWRRATEPNTRLTGRNGASANDYRGSEVVGTSPESTGDLQHRTNVNTSTSPSPTTGITPPRPGSGIGLASLTRPAIGTARTSFSSGSGPGARVIPPFAMRPAPATSSSTSSSHTIPSQPPPDAHVQAYSPTDAYHSNRFRPPLSPLYSSSTSSSDPGESFISIPGPSVGASGGPGPSSQAHRAAYRHNGSSTGFMNGPYGTGVGLHDVDPFSRFWGMLDGCLEEMSRPVAFASAPIGREGVDMGALVESLGERVHTEGAPLEEEDREAVTRRTKGEKMEHASRISRVPRSHSPSESFYMIPEHTASSSVPKSQIKGITKPIPGISESTSHKTSGKTPEELELENEHLRASLDALAVHAAQLERANAAMKEGFKGKETALREVVGEVRKEAERVRMDQSIRSSRLDLQQRAHARHQRDNDDDRSSTGTVTGLRIGKESSGEGEITTGLNARIRELENEVRWLKVENEKQFSQIAKYKDRFERIKANARAKRDAQAGTVPQSAQSARKMGP